MLLLGTSVNWCDAKAVSGATTTAVTTTIMASLAHLLGTRMLCDWLSITHPFPVTPPATVVESNCIETSRRVLELLNAFTRVHLNPSGSIGDSLA
jgi:hypothetical protein